MEKINAKKRYCITIGMRRCGDGIWDDHKLKWKREEKKRVLKNVYSGNFITTK